MTRLEMISNALNRWLSWMAGGFLVLMMLITVANMVMREVCEPLTGTVELIGFSAALVFAFALGYTQIHQGHTRVDVLVSRFPARVRSIIDSVMFFLAMVLFAVVTWRIVELGNRYWELGSLSETLNIIFFPLIYAVALGCAALCLALLLDFLKSLAQVVKK